MSDDTYTETLAVALDDDELRARGKALAEAVRAHDKLVADKKAADARMGAGIKTAQAEVERLAAIVDSGEEDRQVECTLRFDLARNVCEYIRLDTGEPYKDERPLARDEIEEHAQGQLEGVG